MKKFFPILMITIGCLFAFEYRWVFAKSAKLSKTKASFYESVYNTSKFTNLNNTKLDLPKVKSDIIILNFWASWCRPCISEFKSLVELKSRFSDSEIRIIAINGDEEDQAKNVKMIKEKHKLNFDIVLDTDSKILESFKITAIPVSIIFYKGKVIEISNGAKDFSSIESVNEFKKYLKKK